MHRIAPTLVIAALLGLFAVPSAAQTASRSTERSSMPAVTLAPTRLLAELRKGGYLLYFRHAATDMSRNDAGMKSYDDCASQRDLIDRGRADARSIGAAVAALSIPVGQVWASPYCRTMETARLIFGRVQALPEARGGPIAPDQPDRYAELRRYFTRPVASGTNMVISSHGNPFISIAGPPYLAEGEMAVVRPRGNDFEVIARVQVQDWAALVAAR
jgi:phosphohistidine phosphatase SixA